MWAQVCASTLCVCTWVCMCPHLLLACIYMYVEFYARTYVEVYLCMCVYVCACTSAYSFVCVHTRMPVDMHSPCPPSSLSDAFCSVSCCHPGS